MIDHPQRVLDDALREARMPEERKEHYRERLAFVLLADTIETMRQGFALPGGPCPAPEGLHEDRGDLYAPEDPATLLKEDGS